LTVANKADLSEWASNVTLADVLDLVEEYVMAGYRISVKEDPKGFTANMAMQRAGGPNKGLILQEWASTPQRALKRLLWAHSELFKLVWPANAKQEEEDW
jgi:hypothetical protein